MNPPLDPAPWTLGGADVDYASWFLATTGTSLGFTPTGLGLRARVFGGEVFQPVYGSVHVVSYTDPTVYASAIPEPRAFSFGALGMVAIWILRTREQRSGFVRWGLRSIRPRAICFRDLTRPAERDVRVQVILLKTV